MAANRRSSSITKWLLVAVGFALVGYFATIMGMRGLAMGLATGSCAFLGMFSRGPVHGLLRGLLFGAIAGAASAGGVYSVARAAVQYAHQQQQAATAPATTAPTTATATSPATAPTTAPASQPTPLPTMPTQEQMTELTLFSIIGTAGPGALVGALFGYLARRRQQLLEQQWHSRQ